MINKFQQALWILSSGAPILITFSIAWYVNKNQESAFADICVLLCLALIMVAFIIFRMMKTKLCIVEIRAKKIVPNDKCIIGYIISYILPFASIAFDKYNPYVFLGVSILIFIGILISNAPIGNPLLFFAGYHFYDVEAENGIGNYLLISSSKSVRHKNQLTNVIRVTEYLLIDVSEGN